ITAGEEVEIVLGEKWKARSLFIQRAIQSKEAKGEPVMADADGRLPGLDAGTPGGYVLRDSNGVERQRWAVNLPARESDLAALSPQQFEKQLVRAKETHRATLQASLFGAANGQREWWRVLLLAALCLLFAEVLLANRTRA